MPAQEEDKDIWLDFSLGMGGFAEVTVQTTPVNDKRRVRVRVPPGKLIPIVFLPGIMGSNLRLSIKRQAEIQRNNNVSWRPDDTGDALARRNASAADRQLRLDPDEVEVDRYEITSDRTRFDATGAQTRNSDARHDNVPDNLEDVSKLLRSDPKLQDADASHPAAGGQNQSFTAAQKARARGWSEVMFGSYGPLLRLLEKQLNDMLQADGAHIEVAASWKSPESATAIVGRPPGDFGNADAPAITEDDLKKIGNCWYPVHAFGYNWLRSNGDEAKALAPMISRLIQTYQDNGFDCPGVIVVTHSMGGLLARALIHPDYGNLKDKVLGIVHGVMPTTGAAAAYKRMRAGFEGSNKAWWHFLDRIQGSVVKGVLGDNGQEVTAVLANAQGGLELLPAQAYGTGWLRVQNQLGQDLLDQPLPVEDAVSEIYNVAIDADSARAKWWRLINPDWIDPAGLAKIPPDRTGKTEEQIGTKATAERIKEAMKFANAIEHTFHEETHAHFGGDLEQRAWAEVVWKVTSGLVSQAGDPRTWSLLAGNEGDNAEGTLNVLSRNGIQLKLQLQPPAHSGDGTVPLGRSADKVLGKFKFWQTGYEHQESYKAVVAQQATLHGIVKIVTAPALDDWWAKKN